jgi:hypothetical protein
MALDVYAPADITVLLGGVVKLSGYLNGTFLEISKDIQPYVSEITCDDVTGRLYRRNRNYTIKFSISQTSESNTLLSRLQAFDEATQLGMFPLLIKDNSGSTLMFAPTCWIEEIPIQTFSDGIEGRTWGIKATGCVGVIGGNSDSENLTDNLINIALAAAPSLEGIVGDLF